MEKELLEKENQFLGGIDETQKALVLKIKGIIEKIDIGPEEKGFSAWSGERLVSAKEKLSRFSEPLGEWISFHETRSDFAYIWRKGKMAQDFQPMKAKLSKELKTTNVEVENSLIEKYLEQQYYSMFHRRRADFLSLLMEAVSKIIRSIDSRLREIERQYRLPQDAQNSTP